MAYKLEKERLIDEIRNRGSRKVLLQLPDGLKPRMEEIVGEIESKTEAEVFTWFSSCYGACDLPKDLENMGIDLFVQFGHNRFNKEGW